MWLQASAGFKFTDKLKGSGIVWDNETMFNWMTSPKTVRGHAWRLFGSRYPL